MIALYVVAIMFLTTITLAPLAIDAAALIAAAWSANAVQPTALPMKWGVTTNRRR